MSADVADDGKIPFAVQEARAKERAAAAWHAQIGKSPFIPNPILQTFERDVLVALITSLSNRNVGTREQALVLTKLQEALHWADAPVSQERGR